MLALFASPLGCAVAVESEGHDGEPIADSDESYTSGLAVSAAENATAPLGAAVYLDFNGPKCSGVKIASNRFLTAAHCIGEGQRSVKISNGLTPASGPSFTIPAGRVFVHPSFQLSGATAANILSTVYDVAVFEVTESSSGIPVLPITAQPVLGTVGLTAVGYGRTGSNCSVAGTQKLRAGMTATSDSVVDRHVHFIIDVGDPSSCDGDSGGPLIRGVGTSTSPRVVGLDSASTHPANPANSLTQFARISNVAEWILDPTDSTLGNVAGLIADGRAVYLMNGSLQGTAARPGLRCVAQNGTGATVGAGVRLHPCDGPDGLYSGHAPAWRLRATGSNFQVLNRLNSLCLTATSDPARKTAVNTCATSGTTLSNQSWRFEAVTPVGSSPIGVAYRIRNVGQNLCLATNGASGNEGEDVIVASCNSTSNQQWFATR